MSDELELSVNGEAIVVRAPASTTLLALLRDDLGLTGAKEGCDDGECGACTVLLDGVPVTPCILLAHRAAGCAVRTVEGLAEEDRLHPLQEALARAGAVQCGFCTPGIVMTALGTLQGGDRIPSEEEVREALVGNLCRCTGYQKVVEVVLAWAEDQVGAERGSAAGRPGSSA